MRFILIPAAIIPAVWLLIKIYRMDRVEREPIGLILSLVFLGILSTGMASAAEYFGESLLTNIFPEDSRLGAILLYFVVIGLSEEGFKYLLLRLRTWKSPHFNCRFDGMVYAVSVSLGFALWENIAYVIRYGFMTAVMRAFTAVPGHACFGVFMGFWYGLARQYAYDGNYSTSKKARILALVVPAMLHGTYDFIATFDHSVFSLFFIGFVALMFLWALRLARKTARADRYF